ncbi:hypothetical protein LPJ61_005146 [Coemansia biformis]|uniref:Uncharacterized protein n=1 Tax=Coemansia biformis TaxID=1286918 RepID=A0A9W7Y9E6_9FUNG|nr:hypothetical protein LPJ61_005146 [Coemansia biformis]
MQWPRHIAQRYERLLSVPAVLRTPDGARAAAWNRTWLAVNVGMLELRAAYVKRRVLFSNRMSRRQQTALVIRGAFEHAPGLVLNAVMAWRGSVGEILTPHAAHGIRDRYFANAETVRRAVGQAWQLYDWLVHCSPHRTGPAPTMASIPFAARHAANQHAEDTPAAALYAALCRFDSWDEAARERSSLCRGTGAPGLQASDRRLLDRHTRLQSALRHVPPPAEGP